MLLPPTLLPPPCQIKPAVVLSYMLAISKGTQVISSVASRQVGICCRVAFRLRYWELRAADHAEARTPANSPWLRERTLDDAGLPSFSAHQYGISCEAFAQ